MKRFTKRFVIALAIAGTCSSFASQENAQVKFEKSFSSAMKAAYELRTRDWLAAERKGLLKNSSEDSELHKWLSLPELPKLEIGSGAGKQCWVRAYPSGGSDAMMTLEWRFEPGRGDKSSALAKCIELGKLMSTAFTEKFAGTLAIGPELKLPNSELATGDEFYHAFFARNDQKSPTVQLVGYLSSSGDTKDWIYIQVHFQFKK